MIQEKGRSKTLRNSFPPEGVIFSSFSAGLFSHSKLAAWIFTPRTTSHPLKTPKKIQTKLYKKWAKPHPLMTNNPKKNPNRTPPPPFSSASVRCSAASTSGSNFLSASRQSWQTQADVKGGYLAVLPTRTQRLLVTDFQGHGLLLHLVVLVVTRVDFFLVVLEDCVFFYKENGVGFGGQKKLYKANKNTNLWEEWFKKNCFLSTHSDGLKNTFGGRGGDTEHPVSNGCFSWMMNQIFTLKMVGKLEITKHPLKNVCLEFQVGGKKKPSEKWNPVV